MTLAAGDHGRLAIAGEDAESDTVQVDKGVERHRRGHGRRRLVRRLDHDLRDGRLGGLQGRRRGRARHLQGRDRHHRDVRVLRRRLQRLGEHSRPSPPRRRPNWPRRPRTRPTSRLTWTKSLSGLDKFERRDVLTVTTTTIDSIKGRIADARRPVGRRGRRRHGRLQRRAEIQRREPCRAVRPRRLVRLPRGPRRPTSRARRWPTGGASENQRRRRHAPRLQVRRGHGGSCTCPRSITVKNSAGEYKVASSRIQPLYATSDKGRGEHLPVKVEAENVDGRAARVRNRLGRRLVPPTPRLRSPATRPPARFISDATVESVTVNGIEYTRDLDMWTYDKDTGTLDILIAAAGVRSVDIEPPTMPRRTSARGSRRCHRGRRQRVEHRNLGVPVRPPWAGMSFPTPPATTSTPAPAPAPPCRRWKIRPADATRPRRSIRRSARRTSTSPPPVRSLVDRAHLHDRRADGLRRHHPQRDESGPHLRPRRREPLRPARPPSWPTRPSIPTTTTARSCASPPSTATRLSSA